MHEGGGACAWGSTKVVRGVGVVQPLQGVLKPACAWTKPMTQGLEEEVESAPKHSWLDGAAPCGGWSTHHALHLRQCLQVL